MYSILYQDLLLIQNQSSQNLNLFHDGARDTFLYKK